MQLHLPSFAVIVPCYKQERYIDQCIRSLLECKPAPAEIIASDNCCPNGSYEILCRYSDRIRIVRPNQTLPAIQHFNFLASFSSSSYTTLVCADDYVKPSFIKVLGGLAACYPSASILRAGFLVVDGNNRVTRTHRLMSSLVGSATLSPFSLSFSTPYPFNLLESAKGSSNPLLAWAFKTDIFERIGFFDTSIDLCDWSAFLQLASHGSFASSIVPIAYYRVGYRSANAMLCERATKQLNDAIAIGEKFILPNLEQLCLLYRDRLAANFLRKIVSIEEQYSAFLDFDGGPRDSSLMNKLESLYSRLEAHSLKPT